MESTFPEANSMNKMGVLLGNGQGDQADGTAISRSVITLSSSTIMITVVVVVVRLVSFPRCPIDGDDHGGQAAFTVILSFCCSFFPKSSMATTGSASSSKQILVR